MRSQLVIRGPGPSGKSGTLLASPGGPTPRLEPLTQDTGNVCWPCSDLSSVNPGVGKLHSCAQCLGTAGTWASGQVENKPTPWSGPQRGGGGIGQAHSLLCPQ